MLLQEYINEGIEILKTDNELQLEKLIEKAKKIPNFESEILKWKDKNLPKITVSFISKLMISIINLDNNKIVTDNLMLLPMKIAKYFEEIINESLLHFTPFFMDIYSYGWDNCFEKFSDVEYIKIVQQDLEDISNLHYINPEDVLFTNIEPLYIRHIKDSKNKYLQQLNLINKLKIVEQEKKEKQEKEKQDYLKNEIPMLKRNNPRLTDTEIYNIALILWNKKIKN